MFQVGDLKSKSLETFDILSPNYELCYQLSLCWGGFSFLFLSLSFSSMNSSHGAQSCAPLHLQPKKMGWATEYKTALKGLSPLAQPLLGISPAVWEHHAVESRTVLVRCCPMPGNLRTLLVWEKSSLFLKKDAVPRELVSSRLKFVSGYIDAGGTVRGTALGYTSSSSVGRATSSLSPGRRARFLPLIIFQALL